MSWLFVILMILVASIKKAKEKKQYTVSIVIPAYNEVETVASVINIANSISYVNEVIVVDDGSHDGTAEEAKLAGATVISHVSNQGKGAALKTGFRHSKGDIIAFIDGDIHNLSTDKIDSIIIPILKGKTDITKTKFVRESGRVTELTAKPLLKFFFPEVTFDQPLSGQFAGKRSVLNKIKFEKDYGVDVGIVLDADAYGLKIQEVDIGEIKHDLSPLADLNLMATEVVRTIVDRALEYGRVTMIDSLGNYIRLSILGLSIITLSLFIIFFVQGIPLIGGIGIGIAGLGIFLYFIFKVIKKTIYIFGKKSSKKGPKANRNLLKSFIKMHSPLIFSGLVLILMISTFFSAATFDNGVISIEPTSRNLIIGLGLNSNGEIAVRGPYTVDSALENERGLIRIPQDALDTLDLHYGDNLTIDNDTYSVSEPRHGESNILRIPLDARKSLNIAIGEVISDGRIIKTFEEVDGSHIIEANNTIIAEKFFISPKNQDGKDIDVIIDGNNVGEIVGVLKEGDYSILVNGVITNINIKSENNLNNLINSDNSINSNINLSSNLNNSYIIENSYFAYYGEHIIELKVKNGITTPLNFVQSEKGPFLSVYFN